MLKNKKVKITIISILAAFLIANFIFLFADKINLTTADLGRHIQNGEEILSGNFEVLKTNFYSYTNQDFPFINHHWGSGVLFFAFHKIGGFELISIFYILLGLLTFSTFFYLGYKKAGFPATFLTSLFLLPLIASRTEVRPEMISYFLIGIFILALFLYKENKISKKNLFILFLPLQIFWVNLHIYFIFGISITGLFFTNEFLAYIKYAKQKTFNNTGLFLEKFLKFSNEKKEQVVEKIKTLGFLTAGVSIASLINPWGLKGALYPFFIMKNLGYRLVENQSVWFLENLDFYKNPNIQFFEIIFAVLVLSFITIFILNSKKSKNVGGRPPYTSYKSGVFCFIDLVLLFVFSALAFSAIRNFAIFGFILIPFLSYNLYLIYSNIPKLKNTKIIIPIFLIIFFSILSIHYSVYRNQLLHRNNSGIGMMKNNNSSAHFFKTQNIKGPIFNNYDIGGFLIYHLYPNEKVFVDNRPEAYSSGFLQNTYVKMQENEEVWKEKQKEYSFNSVFFYRHDITPWSQKFLIERAKDGEWIPVYVDQYAIIFVKNNEKNKKIIEKFKIPKKFFNIKT